MIFPPRDERKAPGVAHEARHNQEDAMSHNPILHPTMRHPLTGKPLEAVGVLPNGRIVWPIMGSGPENDPPERPDDIAEDVWNTLGDPGKQAIVRERTKAAAAEQQVAALRDELAKTARPTPPKTLTQPTSQPTPAPKPSDQPDIAAIVQQAVAAAIKPFEERDQQRAAETAAGKVRDAVIDAAKTLLHDPTDALANIDLTTVVNDQGQADAAKIKTALDDVVAKKPHLAKGPRLAPPGIGGGAPATATDAEKVKAVLADMQRATGVRLPANTN